jgi:tetratricopeptide (TPR) repeat protein
LLHPELADGYLWRGMASLQDHQNAASIPDLEEAVRREPANSLAIVQLGLAYEAQGNAVKARALFEQALQTAPDASAIAALNQMDIRDNQAAAAVARAQQQIQRAPASSELYDELAKAQLATQDTAAAAASAQHALQLDPGNRDAMQTYTQVELSAGQIGPPIEMWRRWGTDHPADPQAPAALGMLYESAGDSKTAEEFYRQSLSIRPDQPEVSAAVALLSAEEGGNLDVALSMAQAAYRARPSSSRTADAVGWIYDRKGLPSSALGPLQSAVAMDETDASIQYHLGVVQAQLGKKAEAISHLKRAQDLAGGTALATKAQDELRKIQ